MRLNHEIGERQAQQLPSSLVAVKTWFRAAEAGSIEQLQQMGVTYVAVADYVYWRYFDKHVHPAPSSVHAYVRYREFYSRLFREGTLVWSREPENPTNAPTNPGIRLYRIVP